MRISDWSSDVCSSDLGRDDEEGRAHRRAVDGPGDGHAPRRRRFGPPAARAQSFAADHRSRADRARRTRPPARSPDLVSAIMSLPLPVADSPILGRLSLAALPLPEPILVVTFIGVALGGVAGLGLITWYR